MMTVKEIIEVLEAFESGKTIERKVGDTWRKSLLEKRDIKGLLYNITTETYRIKPSPEPEMMIQPNGYIHPKNEHCGKYKCVPYVAEAKEKSYAERQAEWVKATGVKVGEKVKIAALYTKDNWSRWSDGMISKVGCFMEIHNIEPQGIKLSDGWSYPFQSLELLRVPAPAVKLPEGFESHKISKGDFVKISFNGAQLTLSHNAEVLYVPVEFGDYWILKDVYTGDVHYVSELCTITKLFEKKGV